MGLLGFILLIAGLGSVVSGAVGLVVGMALLDWAMVGQALLIAVGGLLIGSLGVTILE